MIKATVGKQWLRHHPNLTRTVAGNIKIPYLQDRETRVFDYDKYSGYIQYSIRGFI